MQNAITSCSLNFLSDIVTELSRISTSSCESRIWALIWGLIYIGKDRWQMTDDNCTESWNNNSETTDCKMKRDEFSQSYFPLQFLKFTKVKPLSKKRMFYSWLRGPLIQNAYHLGPTLSAPPPHSKLHSSLSWRVSLIWEAELWKAKQKDSTLVGRKSFLSFPKEWPIFLLSVCQQSRGSSAGLRSAGQWQSSQSQAQHCAPKGALCSWNCCSSPTSPCSKALFHRQLLRRCPVSWNDPLTFLPLLISKQWIIRTGLGCLAILSGIKSQALGPQGVPKGIPS